MIEPYRKEPFIRSVKRLDDNKSGHVALQVDFFDGTTDYLFQSLSQNTTMRVGKRIEINGTSAFIRERDGVVRKAILIDGTSLRFGKLRLTSSGPISGKIVSMNKELKGGGWIIVDQMLPADSTLIGQQIMVDASGERDAAYTIRAIQPEGDHTRIYCGPISFVRGFKGGDMVMRTATVPRAYDQGYFYDFEEGATFRISIHEEWKP